MTATPTPTPGRLVELPTEDGPIAVAVANIAGVGLWSPDGWTARLVHHDDTPDVELTVTPSMAQLLISTPMPWPERWSG